VLNLSATVLVSRAMVLARRAQRRTSSLGAAAACATLAAGLVLAACDSKPLGSELRGGPTIEPTDAPIATVPADPALAAAIGPWRRVPFKADEAFGAPYVAACAAAEPKIGRMPVAVVDVRGSGWIAVLFAGAKAAYLCRTTVDDPSHPLEIRPIVVPAGTITGTEIDLALWTSVQVATERATYAVGRVGPDPADVIGGFVDQSFVFATHANGWWVAWWPPQPDSDGFAAVDRGHVVLNNVLVPAGGEFPAPSPSSAP